MNSLEEQAKPTEYKDYWAKAANPGPPKTRDYWTEFNLAALPPLHTPMPVPQGDDPDAPGYTVRLDPQYPRPTSWEESERLFPSPTSFPESAP